MSENKKPPSAKVLTAFKWQAGIVAVLSAVCFAVVLPALFSARDSVAVVVGVLLLASNIFAVGWIVRRAQQIL
jgi:hypothetical protein